ncbi:MAG: CPBP family glutamic-type intramembrane protease [Caldisphaera sp.]
MKKISLFDIFMIILPWILWYLTFDVLSSHFIYAMATSTSILGIISLTKKDVREKYKSCNVICLLSSLSIAIMLYFVFYGGNIISTRLGLEGEVLYVYELVPKGLLSIFLLALIGVMEEAYWRGLLQHIILENDLKINWIYAAVLYGIVHSVSLNLILVIAAFIVGLFLSFTAKKLGLIGSSIVHVTWIYLMFLKILI